MLVYVMWIWTARHDDEHALAGDKNARLFLIAGAP